MTHDPATASQEPVLAALARAATYGCAGVVDTHETHASWVFLAGEHAYKLKKAVRLAFLDYSTPELRRAACREEVRVNRELGGDIYGEVLAVVGRGAGVRLAPEDSPGAIDYVLRMRRFDERHTLAGKIAAGGVEDADIRAVARRVAEFHGAATVVEAGGARATLRRWTADLDELERLVDARSWHVNGIRRFAQAFVGRHGEELDRRVGAGMVRDGHGDLRCEHVLLGRAVIVVDRIEFDPGLRRIDVGCDLAFLLMDLEALGQPRAARLLLAEYRGAGGDPGADELVWFHAAHWALVRAKVAAIAGIEHVRTRPAAGGAPELGDLAVRLAWRARGRLVLVIAGMPASGKSTLAQALAARSGLAVVSSDVVRKRLAGVATGEPAPEQAYSAEFTEQTYRALCGAARDEVDHGSGVIVDATFAREADRKLLAQALAGSGAQILFAECRVAREVALARARARERQTPRVSDATAEVVARLYDRYVPPAASDGDEAVVLDAEQPLEHQLEAVSAAADRVLSGNARDVAEPSSRGR